VGERRRHIREGKGVTEERGLIRFTSPGCQKGGTKISTGKRGDGRRDIGNGSTLQTI